MESDPVIQHH
jgi:hypothetical protein